jgi:hypothetical protein
MIEAAHWFLWYLRRRAVDILAGTHEVRSCT